MSFFNDFLNYFKVDDISSKVSVFAVLGVGIVIMGKFVVVSLDEETIELKSGKDLISVVGKDLKVKSISRGELILSGKLVKVETGEQKWV